MSEGTLRHRDRRGRGPCAIEGRWREHLAGFFPHSTGVFSTTPVIAPNRSLNSVGGLQDLIKKLKQKIMAPLERPGEGERVGVVGNSTETR